MTRLIISHSSTQLPTQHNPHIAAKSRELPTTKIVASSAKCIKSGPIIPRQWQSMSLHQIKCVNCFCGQGQGLMHPAQASAHTENRYSLYTAIGSTTQQNLQLLAKQPQENGPYS